MADDDAASASPSNRACRRVSAEAVPGMHRLPQEREPRACTSMWGASKHYRANVGCFECHAKPRRTNVDAVTTLRRLLDRDRSSVAQGLRTLPRAVKSKEAAGIRTTRRPHASSGRSITCWPKWSKGNRAFITRWRSQNGNSAARRQRLLAMPRISEVKVLGGRQASMPLPGPTPVSGRLNPDGSEGSCSACHSRHTFSVATRHATPDTCGKCHLGPDHPQKEIYEESKHGIAFLAFNDQLKMNLESPKWVVGEDYHLAPTCANLRYMSATPSMSATKDRAARPGKPVTHDVGMRISWNNRPASISVRPEASERSEDGPCPGPM